MSEFNDKFEEAKDWIDTFKEGMLQFSLIYSTYDEFKKYKEIIDKVPEQESVFKVTLESKLLGPVAHFVDSLGPALKIDSEGLSFSAATASSGSVYLIDEVQNYESNDSAWFPRFKNEVFKVIEGIQKEKDSVAFIQATFDNLHSPLGIEFKELVELHVGYIASVEFASSFGIKMRNLLEHFRGVCSKGAVVEKYGSFKELKVPLTWKKISEFAALGGKDSKYDNEFSKNSSIYSDLHNSLSKDAKDYSVDDVEKLPQAFVKTIQYLESSIKLIDLQKIKNAL